MHVNIWSLRYGTKNIVIGRKINKLDIIKIKNVYASKGINKMWEDKEWEKFLQIICLLRDLSGIFEKLLLLNNRKKNNLITSWKNIWVNSILIKVHKWSINTRKDAQHHYPSGKIKIKTKMRYPFTLTRMTISKRQTECWMTWGEMWLASSRARSWSVGWGQKWGDRHNLVHISTCTTACTGVSIVSQPESRLHPWDNNIQD